MNQPQTRESETGDPQTIAVLGASNQRHKYGNKCVRAYASQGWRVYPVNLDGGEIEGLHAYRELAEIPVELDRISVYLPPPITLEELPAIAAKGAAEVWLNPGSADDAVLAAARGIEREGELEVIAACSIVAIGLSPAQFP